MNEFDIEKIGYYKYKSHIPSLVDCIKEYPITEEIKDYIQKNEKILKIETENDKPVQLNGKYIVLI